jgi:protein ImuB
LVYAANQQALSLGVYPGMAVSQAQAMLPKLQVEPADPVGDAAALKRLAGWCLRFSPLAACCAPDGVWIDITGCAHLHGGEDALLNAVLDRLAEAGVNARAAVADTPGCAHAMARHGLDVLCVVPPGGQAKALANLPVRALRLEAEISAALQRLGFDTVGQLAAAPRAPLARRFGGELMRRLDQAMGRVPEPLEPVLPPDLCRVRQGFAEPIATPEDLRRVTVLLAEQLCEKLRLRDQGACRLDLVFLRVDGVAQMVRVGTAAPTRDAAHIARLLVAGIETVDPGFGVESVMLAAPLTDALGARQTLSALTAPAEADLAALIDTLINRLGAGAVFRAAPVESDIPERAVRAAPPLAALGGRNWPAHLPRPPRLLAPPRRVEAMALLPDHPPVQFTWRKKPHRVRRADGPERVYGEWWLDDDAFFAVRDYFQVEDEAGQRFWLFRQGDGERPETGDMGWFLHGLFG